MYRSLPYDRQRSRVSTLLNMHTSSESLRKSLNGLRGKFTLYVNLYQRSSDPSPSSWPTYFHDVQKLIITMPSKVHEAPLMQMGFMIESTVASMPLWCKDYKVAIRYHCNMLVRGDSSSSILDIHLTISAGGGGNPYLQIPRRIFFVKCTFMETEAHVKKKLKNLINDHPDALAAMIINIGETRHPLPPATSSIAEAHATSKLVLEKEWLPLCDGNNSLLAIYDGIKLLDVKSVDISIWVRDLNSNKSIDFDDHDSSVYAKGVLRGRYLLTRDGLVGFKGFLKVRLGCDKIPCIA